MVWSAIFHADAAQDVAEPAPAPAPAPAPCFDIQPPWSLSDVAALFRFVTPTTRQVWREKASKAAEKKTPFEGKVRIGEIVTVHDP